MARFLAARVRLRRAVSEAKLRETQTLSLAAQLIATKESRLKVLRVARADTADAGDASGRASAAEGGDTDVESDTTVESTEESRHGASSSQAARGRMTGSGVATATLLDLTGTESAAAAGSALYDLVGSPKRSRRARHRRRRYNTDASQPTEAAATSRSALGSYEASQAPGPIVVEDDEEEEGMYAGTTAAAARAGTGRAGAGARAVHLHVPDDEAGAAGGAPQAKKGRYGVPSSESPEGWDRLSVSPGGTELRRSGRRRSLQPTVQRSASDLSDQNSAVRANGGGRDVAVLLACWLLLCLTLSLRQISRIFSTSCSLGVG